MVPYKNFSDKHVNIADEGLQSLVRRYDKKNLGLYGLIRRTDPFSRF